jgi:hypothetical protein
LVGDSDDHCGTSGVEWTTGPNSAAGKRRSTARATSVATAGLMHGHAFTLPASLQGATRMYSNAAPHVRTTSSRNRLTASASTVTWITQVGSRGRKLLLTIRRCAPRVENAGCMVTGWIGRWNGNQLIDFGVKIF